MIAVNLFMFISFLAFSPGIRSFPATELDPIWPPGQVITVNASGGGDYTRIQWAMDNSSKGDTIYVEAGIYFENIIINKTVTLIGAGRENTTIDGREKGYVVKIEANYVKVNGFNITGSNDSVPYSGIHMKDSFHCNITSNICSKNNNGIYLEESLHNTISDNLCYNNQNGITIHYSNNNNITENVCENNSDDGICLYDSCENKVVNNLCSFNGDYGINVGVYSNKNEIILNNCSHNYYGISLTESNHNNITENICLLNKYMGINLYGSLYNSIGMNTCVSNRGRGMSLWSSANNIIYDNKCQFNWDEGIRLYRSSSNYLESNTCNSNYDDGILLSDSHGKLHNNTCNYNNGNGISVIMVYNSIIYRNTCKYNDHGIYFSNSNNNQITGNTAVSNDAGIRLDSSYYNSLQNNSCTSNVDGVYFISSHDNSILNNTVSSNEMSGIALYDSSNDNFIENNLCHDNLCGIKLEFNWRNSVTSNHCSQNQEGIKLYGSRDNDILNNTCANNYYGLRLESGSDKNSVKNNDCNHNTIGISTHNADDCDVYSNTCSNNNQNGISITNSLSNNITSNICSSNLYNGISMEWSSNNMISENNCGSNNMDGINVYHSSTNVFSENILTSNHRLGISIELASSNIIIRNQFSQNTRHGIHIISGESNNIYQNDLIKNNKGGIQGFDDGYDNEWNSSDKGNYWSDWNWPDNDGDNIIDVHYILSGVQGAVDYFPLEYPFSTVFPVADAGEDVVINQHQTVHFDSSGCQNSEFIRNYSWSFYYNNSFISLWDSSPNFVFHNPGTYNISLSVSNAAGAYSEDTMFVTVKDTTPPVFIGHENITIEQHETVNFNAMECTDHSGIVNYTWTFLYDWGCNCLYGPSPSFTFSDAGEFDIILRLTDACGNWAVDTKVLTVLDTTPPRANAGRDKIIYQQNTVILSSFGSRDNVGITNYTWYHGYNRTSTISYSEATSMTLDIPGYYNIALTVSDAMGNSDTDIVNVTVLDMINPKAHAGEDTFINSSTEFQFNSSGSTDNIGIVNYTWLIRYNGTDHLLYGPNPTFFFDIGGKYYVYLYVTDGDNNMGSDHISITVNSTEDEQDDDYGIYNRKPVEDDRSFSFISSLHYIVLLAVILVAIIVLLLIDRWRYGDDVDSKNDERIDAIIPLKKMISTGSEMEFEM